MTTTIKVSEAKTHLFDVLARVEAGEDFVIARGSEPIARITRAGQQTGMQLLLAEVRAARTKAASSTHEEVLSWQHESRR